MRVATGGFGPTSTGGAGGATATLAGGNATAGASVAAGEQAVSQSERSAVAVLGASRDVMARSLSRTALHRAASPRG